MDSRRRRDPVAAVMAAARRIIERYPEELAAASAEIVTTDRPSQRVVNAFFARIGETRFLGGRDDVWEAIACAQNGWTYERPPRHLIDRWASY